MYLISFYKSEQLQTQRKWDFNDFENLSSKSRNRRRRDAATHCALYTVAISSALSVDRL